MDQVANHCGLNHWWMNDLPFPTGSIIKTVSRQESHSSIPITEERPTKTTMRPNTIKTDESRLVCQTNARSQSAQSISSHLLNSKQHLVGGDIGPRWNTSRYLSLSRQVLYATVGWGNHARIP